MSSTIAYTPLCGDIMTSEFPEVDLKPPLVDERPLVTPLDGEGSVWKPSEFCFNRTCHVSGSTRASCTFAASNFHGVIHEEEQTLFGLAELTIRMSSQVRSGRNMTCSNMLNAILSLAFEKGVKVFNSGSKKLFCEALNPSGSYAALQSGGSIEANLQ
jgi:hypothetical protein